ncbi:MAG: Spy/CpxP family protein refolding chaperone [Acidobacteria bacterium]|nr:Spy/CpxP family protein refolding chaperone [Acidobacteriota bacterium]MCA1639231.1 Spy/CpxP family protein refolding chaperone [Acidobacteriota bacterium]
MSLKHKFFSGLTLAFAFVAFTTFVAAQDSNTNQPDSMQKQERRERRGFGKRGEFGKEGKRGGRHGGDKMLMRGVSSLNLTDSQKEQTRTIFENFNTSTKTQRDEMRALAMKRRDGIITAEETARFKELRTQLKTSGEQMHNSILAILTPEQRTKLDQIKEDRKQKMEERRQMRQNRQLPDTKKTN